MSDPTPDSSPDSANVPPPLYSSGPALETCVECGHAFPADEMIHHGHVSICANCKPIFMQKLAEGAKVDPAAFHYAGFWIRFAAIFIDGIVLGIVGFAVRFLFGLNANAQIAPASDDPSAVFASIDWGLIGLSYLVSFILGVSYETFMVGKYGATLGKMACKIKIVTPDGGRVSYLRAFGRYFGKILSYAIFYIGYIMAGFDEEKRALHDRICGTRVIYK